MKKTVIIFSILFTLCGSIFASYDMFIFANKFNNKLFPLCYKWESMIKEIEPYTMYSRTPIQEMKPFFILKSTETYFLSLLNIIKMNKHIVMKAPVTQVVISVPAIHSGTRLGGYVYLNNIEGKDEFVSSPDILIQWIQTFRRTWFLKWGFVLIAIGAFLQLLAQLNIITKTGVNNMGEKTLLLYITELEKAKRLILLFFKPILWFIFLLFSYLLFLWILSEDQCKMFVIVIIIIFFILSHTCVEHLLIKLYKYVIPERPRDPNKLTAFLGYIDRLLYAICFAFQQYTVIGLWLGIKIAQRLVQFSPVALDDHEKIKQVGERKNIFLIGNITSLILGLMAGYLIMRSFNLPNPNFFIVM